MDDRERFMRDLIDEVNKQAKTDYVKWEDMTVKEKQDGLKIAQGMFNLGWAKMDQTGEIDNDN